MEHCDTDISPSQHSSVPCPLLVLITKSWGQYVQESDYKGSTFLQLREYMIR